MNVIIRRPTALVALLATLCFAAAVQAHEGEEHGNHDAAHGGFVLMYQDLHFEVVSLPEGGVELHYTDAARNLLPAATVSDVAVEIESGAGVQTVPMSMSAGGDFWEGPGAPLRDPQAIIRVAFVFQGEPLVIDVPASFLPRPDDEVEGRAAMVRAGAHAGH